MTEYPVSTGHVTVRLLNVGNKLAFIFNALAGANDDLSWTTTRETRLESILFNSQGYLPGAGEDIAAQVKFQHPEIPGLDVQIFYRELNGITDKTKSFTIYPLNIDFPKNTTFTVYLFNSMIVNQPSLIMSFKYLELNNGPIETVKKECSLTQWVFGGCE